MTTRHEPVSVVTSASVVEQSGIDAIEDWAVGYVKRHPLASLTTVGEQFVLGVRTLEYFAVDLLTGRFQWQEFVRQGAFMAGTAVLPTILVALPISVTLSVQFALLAGQVGATSLAGAASGLAVVRQGALVDNAMPRFGELSPEDLVDIQQYIRSRARDSIAGK